MISNILPAIHFVQFQIVLSIFNLYFYSFFLKARAKLLSQILFHILQLIDCKACNF